MLDSEGEARALGDYYEFTKGTANSEAVDSARWRSWAESGKRAFREISLTCEARVTNCTRKQDSWSN